MKLNSLFCSSLKVHMCRTWSHQHSLQYSALFMIELIYSLVRDLAQYVLNFDLYS